MDDLISRQAAIDEVQRHRENVLGGYEYDEGVAFVYAAAHNHIIEVIKRIPSAQKKGKWVSSTIDGKIVPMKDGSPVQSCWCSECGDWLGASDEYAVKGNFCPNCGADMRGESDG